MQLHEVSVPLEELAPFPVRIGAQRPSTRPFEQRGEIGKARAVVGAYRMDRPTNQLCVFHEMPNLKQRRAPSF